MNPKSRPLKSLCTPQFDGGEWSEDPRSWSRQRGDVPRGGVSSGASPPVERCPACDAVLEAVNARRPSRLGPADKIRRAFSR